VRYRVAEDRHSTEVVVDAAPGGGLRIRAGDVLHALSAGDAQGALVPLELDGRRMLVGFTRLADGRYHLVVDGISHVLQVDDPVAAGAGLGEGPAAGGQVRAPIPGLVVTVHVALGDRVAAGAPLVTLYAMKLENEIRAPAAGTVAALPATQGRAVEKGELLVRLDP
jgi:pyruvate carboxylase subunit B